MAVVAEHACGGSTGAAPIGRAVVQAYFEKNFPEMLKKDGKSLVTTPAAPLTVTAPKKVESIHDQEDSFSVDEEEDTRTLQQLIKPDSGEAPPVPFTNDTTAE